MSNHVALHPQGTKRIGADGLVSCGQCGQRKPPHAFTTTGNGYPGSYCRRCRSQRSGRYQKRRAFRDPEWYAAWQARVAHNRALRRKRRAAERLQLAQAAIAWMRSRGFWQREIAHLAGCTEETVIHWKTGRFGTKGYPSVAARLTVLHRVTSDIPAWPERNRLRDKTHPWLGVVAARLREVET